MTRLETWYKQDLKRPLVVHKHTDVFNQDSKGNLIGVEVYSDGEPVALSGSISGYCLLADGTTVPAVGASRSGNKASVLIPQTAYSVPGPITITIKNVDGENIATLCATVGIVRQSVSGNLVNPGSVVTDWSNDINDQLQAVQTAVDNVGAIVAAPFDENTVYVVGNYVTNNGNLYRITADHASGVAWANTAKVQCTVGHELEALNNHFVADWNLIDPDAASGNETDFLPVELNIRYNIIHAQSKGQFQYGLSLYDSNKTMLYISQLVDEATDGTNYIYSCTFSQSAIAYVKLKINSAPSGIDTTDFSKVYFGKGSEYIEFDDYNVINAIKKVKDDVADLADEISNTQSDVSDLGSALGTVPSGKTAQGQIDDNANDISDLKSALTAVKDATTVQKNGDFETVSTTWSDGYINDQGGSNSSSSYQHTAQIDVSAGEIIKLIKQSDDTEINKATYVTAYVNGSAVSALGGYNKSLPYIVPDTVTRVVFSLASSIGNIVVKKADAYLENSEHEDVALLKSKTLGVENETNAESVTFTSGYVAKNGTISSNSSYKYTNKITVEPGDIIDFYSSNGTSHISSARFVTIYKNNSAIESLGSENASFPYTVPEGADAVIFSIAASLNNIVCYHTKKVVCNSEKPRVDAIINALLNEKANRFIWNFDLSANSTYTANKELQDICGYRICFFAKVGTFSGITRIGKAESQTYGGAIGFDGTNLYEYLGNVTTATRTKAHGLTIKDYVGLIIDLHYNGETIVTLSTNGGSYTWTVPFWRSQYGQITVYSASALSDCELSYTCEGILKETWLYGDSYFANTGVIRWTSYLISKGYSNFLLNAYPGRNSLTALASLKTDLELGKSPKRIVWCMGMNDTDSNSAPSANWKNALDKVIEICEQNKIELVLATIPNVPGGSNINTYKNNYVKASGYRYIPFAAAISADESSTWYDGMLETVSGGGYGIHPTEQGALCLFNCAVSAVPELLW